MTENREGFDLNRLDQQIEYPAGSLDARASQLVDDLHQMYQASPSDSRANAESLRRVQQRLQARFAPQETKPVSLRALPTRQERKSFMQEKNSERKSGWKRVSRTFNTLAAVLVVAILIGSAVTLVNLKNHARSTQVGTQKQATATPTPQPSHDCSPIFTESNPNTNFTMTDNGEHAVCTQGLEESLNETTKVNGHQVTLISAYADTNQLLIKWAMSDKLSQNDEVLPPTSLTLQDGTTLPLGDQIWYDDTQNQQWIELVSYGTQQVPASTTSLQITLNPSGVTSVNNTITSSGDGTFNFTVPLHKEKRVATPKQSVQINGHTFTLERVVVTESETMFYLKVDPVLAPYDAVQIRGTIDGKDIDMGPDTDASGSGKGGNQVSFSGPSEEDFMSKQGVWTLNLRGVAGTPLGVGSGGIQFTVPPAA